MLRLLVLTWALLAAAGSRADTPLVTVEARPHPVAVTFPADGLVEAVQQSVVAAQVPGRVVEVKADAGQQVKKGEVLMRIDAREAAQAAAGAEAQYINAKVNYERTQRLVQQKFLSSAALDKAKADFDAAAANRGAAVASQSHAVIQAPVSGIVAWRHAELGDMAQPGKPLFTVFEPGALRVVASVPQYQLKAMQGIGAAKIEFPELGRWVDSAALTILPAADAATHVSQARVVLPADPQTLSGIRPGMFARVHFVLGQAVKLTVPAGAVVRRGEVAGVYVQAADGKFALRQLRLGSAVGAGEIEVLAGLTDGEKVATDPIKAGIAVRAGSKP